MKKIKAILIGTIVLSIFITTIVTANTLSPQKPMTTQTIDMNSVLLNPSMNAAITIYVSEGEGCGCIPIRYVPVTAQGLTTDHNDSGTTDVDGMVILNLEYDEEYRILIEAPSYQQILFDVTINEDQTFRFHLKKGESEPTTFPVLNQILKNIETIKAKLNLNQY